ncbi:hypothetical protein ASD50_08305 [Mesorhizobium sp. Root552]|jgi:hypothetical protein|uniref:hypothetical protein n=1 Tax=Mesorhizobium sp. Root552 TaxID=1736555 RepID=UPI00070175D2|nr:hypothetical protein [Mesorhizobium sp. Root552]KQZ19460.1 hypothetical protein ASD50_08305 [Mesorhizobium sp. Root552]
MIAAYVHHLNDNSPDDVRQSLIPFLPRLIDTAAAEELEQARSEFFAWKAIRVFAPAALRAGRYSKRRDRYATRLESLTELRVALITTEKILNTLRGDLYMEDWPPATFAVRRAFEAARAACCFANSRDDHFGGASAVMPYESCPHAAAGAAFQAYRAGCETAWSLALETLGEVLSVRTAGGR